MAATSITDPLYSQQWHLRVLGGSIEKIWSEYTGAGIHSAVYDDGLQKKHEDLAGGYDATHEIRINGVLADPGARPGFHGTAVAGVMAAQVNGLGGVGVSHGVSLTGVDIFGGVAGGNNLVAAMNETFRFDTVNMSWGWSKRYEDNATADGSFGKAFVSALEKGAVEGREGLGTVLVNSAGNYWTSQHQETNSSAFSQSRHTITVGAVGRDGDVSDYSARGASLLVSAPSSGSGGGLATADSMGLSGFNATNYNSSFGGTSAAAPVVTGVVNLMLDANDKLGWRDVQNILAITADHTGKSGLDGSVVGRMQFGWTINGADNVDGGGLHYSNDVGYGRVDLFEAVRYAEVWNRFAESQTSANEIQVSAGGKLQDLSIGKAPTEFTFSVNDDILLEHVDLKLTLTHGNVADLQIELVSPDGTTTVVQSAGGTGVKAVDWSWIFGSDALRGESAKGEWTVRISDPNGGPTGSVSAFAFDAFGSAKGVNDVYHYTSDFQKAAAADGDRAMLHDADGGVDWINASGLVTNSVIDLSEGATSKIGGRTLTIAAGTVMENAVTGDGADTLRGNAHNNVLVGMRGDDQLEGLGGADTLDGGAGFDTASYLSSGQGVDVRLERQLQIGGDAEGDALISIQAVIGSKFDDVLMGDAGANRLSGEDGNDSLHGGDGNDELLGGRGDDTLSGGGGEDVLTGGAGSDVFVYDSAKFGRDTITDFTTGTDKVDLRGSGYSYSSFVFEWVSSNLFAWVGSVGSQIGIQFTKLGRALTALDFIDDDVKTGPDHATSPDTAAPGEESAKDDSPVSGAEPTEPSAPENPVKETTPPTIEAPKEEEEAPPVVSAPAPGKRQTVSAIDHLLGALDQHLSLTGAAVAGTGNALANKIVGNARDNILVGGAGNDTLLGGDGNDTIDGGDGKDTLDGNAGADLLRGGAGADKYFVDHIGDVVDETFGQAVDDGSIDMVVASVDYTLGRFVETLSLAGNAVKGVGNELDNRIVGNDLGNVLIGGAGDDTIVGSNGHDVLRGDEGNDRLSGGAGNDTLEGGSGLDTLDGGNGADVMRGGAGADKYLVDDINDVVDETFGQAADDGAVDTVIATVDYTLGRFVENLTLKDGAVRGAGNELANKIVGNELNNILIGGAGNDTLSGGAGNDQLHGGAGRDVLTGGAGADWFVFDKTALGGADKVTDFRSADGDRIVIVGADFGLSTPAHATTLAADRFQVGTSASLGHAQFLFDARTGTLSWDDDGRAGGAVAIATLGSGANLMGSDILVI
ncbi:S8 family serine peptidase [Aureimonas phyllosphaerae]|uniref:S8 family serine peptidase n=1 Tax=Aureimonas phyllosphaerae TaxID=1166078 RepID=UPI003A5B95E0